jgi:uncharacterized protein (DUF433 family)
MTQADFYQGRDPRELPLYRLAEVARYLHIPRATLRSWVVGRQYPIQDGSALFSPLITPPADSEGRLSFYNLVEVHVLRSLRTVHQTQIAHVRTALDYASQALEIERLLLSPDLHTAAGELFIKRYGELINLSRSGQIALHRVLDQYLSRIERDTGSAPLRLYPFYAGDLQSGRTSIVIDPRIAFGRPTLSACGVSTAVITQRIDAGESPDDLAADYAVEPDSIADAILYEQAA